MKNNSLILLLFLIKFAYFQDEKEKENEIKCNTKIITIEEDQTAKYCNNGTEKIGDKKCCYAKALLYGKKYHFCKYIDKKISISFLIIC